MNKSKLVSFINKYYLNGTVNSVVLKSNSDKKQLSARFISGDKNLLGELGRFCRRQFGERRLTLRPMSCVRGAVAGAVHRAGQVVHHGLPRQLPSGRFYNHYSMLDVFFQTVQIKTRVSPCFRVVV